MPKIPVFFIAYLCCAINLLTHSIALGQGRKSWDNSALDGAGMPGLKYQAAPYFNGKYLFPGALDVIPFQKSGGEEELLILGRRGQIWAVSPSDLQSSIDQHLVTNVHEHFKDGRDGKPPFKQFQLLSGLFDRDWPKRPYLYLAVHQQIGMVGQCSIVRYKVGTESGFALNETPQIIYSWDTNNHNGCDLSWGPNDGYLYVTAGDGSVQRDPKKVGQQVHVVRGSILRFDVHSKPDAGLAYTVPKDNPFVGMDDVLPEIWAYGLRNPWRSCFHPTTGELWVADNGEDLWEMLHCVKRGSNAGWSSFEGYQPFNRDLPLAGPNPSHTPPRLVQPHTELRSIIGGVFYRGQKFPELQGHYIYGCAVTREVWAVSYDANKDILGKPFRIAKISKGTLTAVREDHQRELLILSLYGTIETLTRRQHKQAFRPWPKDLVKTGLFADVASQQPAPGVLEYNIQAPAWADGANTRRFVAIPGRPLVQIGNNRFYGSLQINSGGALAKTFYLDGTPVETQVLYNSGTWQGYTYKWDSTGKTASLVQEEGETVELALNGKKKTWRYPSRSECMTCHTQHSFFGIAFTTPQLNLTNPNGHQQLDQWLQMKTLRNNKDLQKRREVKLANPYDPSSGTLEERARAYLHVNCAHCHHKTGMGGRAALELEYHVSLAETGLIGGTPMIGLLGKPGAKLIVPGNAELSELLGRMNRRGAGQMPLFGSHEIDEAGVALIRDWINSLPKSESSTNLKNKEK